MQNQGTNKVDNECMNIGNGRPSVDKQACFSYLLLSL